ncbi:hypothetical protein BA3_0005 [Thalassomonas phage BA3]|uniref:hypothetical protein n=1 Tax=Thalassomonas phage BA3 TaxID=469660 RepID=UPI00015D958A|nr:hypothetical protein BA3_0005 [Thalassomonas phage BA3]ABV74290.1 hypothetical protein BA3_0005 [Thalassomonas phage BA3]
MAANRFGIDVGELYRTKAAVEGARTRNKMAQLQLSEAEREVAERPKREAEAKKRNVMLTGLRQRAVTGDTAAQQQLLAIDPEGGAAFIEAVAKMDERNLESAQRKVDEMGQMAATVLNAAPEKQERLYKQMLTTLPPESVAKMPQELDLNFLEVSLSKAMAMDKILENPKAIQVGDEDIVYQRGKEITRGKRPTKKTGTGESGVKSADESLIYRQAAELMGGMFDEAGNLRVLDPEVRPKVQAIATRASEIFKQGGVTRSQAVTMAAEEVEGQQTPENDPLGIR